MKPFQDRVDYVWGLAERELWRWRTKLLVFTDEEKQELFEPSGWEGVEAPSTRDHFKRYTEGMTARDPLNQVLEVEFRSIFADQVLCYADRLSMAHSLEVRSPFLDQDFMSLAASIPGEWKIREGEVKYILKKAAERYLPKEAVWRPKEGFLMPVTHWLMSSLKEFVRDVLSEKNLQRHGYLKPRGVSNLLDLFYSGDTSPGIKIFTLLSFQVWYDRYMACQPTCAGVGV
jgi:asparagine synthase (glutamine-hydrolysing)